MKAFILLTFLTAAITNPSYSQLFKKNQFFTVFGIKIKAKDVVGNKNFNDLGLKYPTNVINNLTDDTTTYLWRLGAVRLKAKDYSAGSVSLFDLSTANHMEGYPLLDSIDFTFYRERGFQILEAKEPTLLANIDYQHFKDTMSSTSISLQNRRKFLWLDTHTELRNKLLNTRYFINTQPISLKQKITKKVTAEINAALKTDLNDLLKVASSLKDTTNNQKVDTIGLRAYFDRTISRSVDLTGMFISVEFQSEYIDRIKFVIEKIGGSDPMVTFDNEFNDNLRMYIPSQQVALNSALFAFKFTGGIDRRNISVDSIKTALTTLFNIGSVQAATLATTANFMYSRHLDEAYNNQFSKVWLIMFATDEVLDQLKFRDVAAATNRK